MSATPASTALRVTNRLAVVLAMTRARVVLPVPGGPERSIEESWSFWIARRRSRPGPTMCSCPANSSRLRGRIREASGSADEAPREPPPPWAEKRAYRPWLAYWADHPDQELPFQTLW